MRRTRAATLEVRVGEDIDNVGPWWCMALAHRLDEEEKCREAMGVLGTLLETLWATRSFGTRATARSEDEAKDDDENMVVDEQAVPILKTDCPTRLSAACVRISQAAKRVCDWLA